MPQALFEVVLYAVMAGVSPLAIGAAVTVVNMGRPRALAFGLGFVAAQLGVCALFVALGVSITRSGSSHYAWLQVIFTLALAALLLWFARRVGKTPPRKRSSSRTRELLERLRRLGPFTTVAAGVLLGVGGPKRLVLSALAATAITTAEVRHSVDVALIGIYVAIATVTVWAPVTLFVILGARAMPLLAEAQDRVRRRQPKITVNALLILAAFLVVDAAGVVITQVR